MRKLPPTAVSRQRRCEIWKPNRREQNYILTRCSRRVRVLWKYTSSTPRYSALIISDVRSFTLRHSTPRLRFLCFPDHWFTNQENTSTAPCPASLHSSSQHNHSASLIRRFINLEKRTIRVG
ncbi:hypothetical protein NDU88_005090 [Pleurodeles waltl]|uniref:Uncharacterized protein n=1 Tax=Pleurodeles waltl TaxID=8319 RepID=A0AAV7SKQ5_PLEWA|nr:hypothetical protein NDU88_005090 [Pleurodeles waltl]